MQWEIIHPLRLAALVVLPLLIYYWRRSLLGFAPWQRAASLAIRGLLVTVLVVALCDIRWTTSSRQLSVVFAVDESLSISETSGRAAETFLNEALRQAGRNQSARLPFALRPGGGTGITSVVDRRGTDLAAAVAAAAAATRSGYVPRLVLLSDGNQTTGDALAAARAATMPVWTVPLPGLPDHEVYVSAVESKPEVRQGEPFDVDVVVQSTGESDGTVRLLEAGRPVTAQREHVIEGQTRFHFRHVLTGQSQALLTAELEGFQDTLAENNRASALVLITGRPRVLLIEGQPDLAGPLATALSQQYIDVDIRPPDRLPDAPAGLQGYELLMLDNVPAAALSAAQMEAARQYVRDFGGGLIVLGGERALTAGGYHGTILEEILPVRCEPREDQPQPGLAMVLVIDRSASMAGTGIELAKQATRQAVERLAQRDQVGVMAFHDESQWVSPIQPCSHKQQVLDQINTLTAGGGTNLYPAMEKAYLALREAFADRKHMIVLSDGLSHPGEFEALTRDIAASGITVSTVAVGDQAAQQLLQDIARRGQGHYYFCQDAAAVPRVFVLEATTAGRLGVIEALTAPRPAGAQEVFGDVDLKGLPPLLGYVQTIAKPDVQLILSAENDDPLLTCWRYGRGVSTVFTSSVQQSWAPLWLKWPGLGPFWARLVRHAMRPDDAPGFVLRVERKNDRTEVILDAVDSSGQYVNGAEAALKIVDSHNASRKVPLVQIAPGRYAANSQFSIFNSQSSISDPPAAYRLEVTLTRGGRTIYVGRRGLVVDYADELRLKPTDQKLLRSIAEITGGRYDPRPDEVFAPPAEEDAVRRTASCLPYLLTAATLIFLIDVMLKRIDLMQRRS
jgi:Mg-chelatase subunit ChlD